MPSWLPNLKRAWEEEADEDDNGPSEAFLLLQKELEEKETIQRENEERVKNEEAVRAEAAKALQEKVGSSRDRMPRDVCREMILMTVGYTTSSKTKSE